MAGIVHGRRAWIRQHVRDAYSHRDDDNNRRWVQTLMGGVYR